MNEKLCILIRISLKFVPKGPIDNKPAFVQVTAWRQTGNKPLLEAILAEFTDAICAALDGAELIDIIMDISSDTFTQSQY